MRLENLQRLAAERTEWPTLDGYDILHGLVFGSGRCLSGDARFLSNAEQDALLPPLPESVAQAIDAALAQRIRRIRTHTDTPPKTD